MANITRDELIGHHGVALSTVLDSPNVKETEGLECFEFNTAKSKFEADEATLTVSLLIGDRRYKLSYDGYRKAMKTAGFSDTVIKQYPAPLMMEPLNYGFQNRVSEVKAFLKNTGDDNSRVVAFVKPSVELVSTKQLIETVHKVCGEETLFERLDHDLFFTHCSAIVPSMTHRWNDGRFPEVGDVIFGGINFQNSLMGDVPLEVSVYVYRLVCSNGTISRDSSFKWSRKTETVPLYTWFEEHVKASFELFNQEFEKIDKLRNVSVNIDHRAELMSNIFAEYGISERLRQLVLEYLVNNPPNNMWDVVNAITYIANNEELQSNPHTIRRLQATGGDMLAKLSVCPTCYSIKRH